MIEKYQKLTHDLLEKSMKDMKELLDANDSHNKETLNVEILHLRDLIALTNNEIRDDIKRLEITQLEVNKFREKLALVCASVKSLHKRLDLQVPALLDEED
jgi:phage FluMu gp28-like protein